MKLLSYNFDYVKVVGLKNFSLKITIKNTVHGIVALHRLSYVNWKMVHLILPFS